MATLSSHTLLATPLLHIRDVQCSACRGRHVGAAECDAVSHIVIPYRGSFVRQVGSRVAHADVNQALFFNAAEEYRIDHFGEGGDACLSLDLSEGAMNELARSTIATTSRGASFREMQRRIDPAMQLQAARLRYVRAQTLGAEELALRLIHRLLGLDGSTQRVTAAGCRLIHRAKQILHAGPRHRWSLAEIAREVGASPVYLTQAFSKVEGMPLYRYQTQLRLALALNELPHASDLAAMALDLGFTSHSQFTTAFKRAYGIQPSACRRELLKNRKARPATAN